ncbi:ankyrin repeat [Fusarium longipes]|uniref:Ankyrin repeat n=1 Tax=Fusarium longipes TaxID=694270 RepID=A0A395S988_9HYPO|nr:ankyrin repeat [Fusarium longipes]
MDPVSIVGIVGSSLTIATRTVIVLKDIYDYYKQYRDAPDHIKYLAADVQDAQKILRVIKQQLDTKNTIVDPSELPTYSCEEVLKKVETFADKHSKRLESPSNIKAKLGLVRFTWNEKEIKNLRDELQRRILYLKWVLPTRPTIGHDTVQFTNSTTCFDTKASKGLIDASDVGDVAAIKKCLEANADINYLSREKSLDRSGHAAIHLAAKKGHLPAVQVLVRANANIDIASPLQNETALQIAARNDQLAVVRYLVSQGAKLDVQDLHGETPLTAAISEDIQLALLAAGAGPNIKTLNGYTALHRAIGMGFVESVRKLVDRGALVNAVTPNGNFPLRLAFEHTELSEEKIAAIVEILLHSTTGHNTISIKEKEKLFFDAMRQDKLKVLRAILTSGTDILQSLTLDDLFPIHLAARDGPVRILRELLRFVDVDTPTPKTGIKPLHLAVASGNEACVRTLLENNAVLHRGGPDGLIPLHFAFLLPKTTIAEMIIQEHKKRGMTINYATPKVGILPIHLASSPAMVELWAKHGGLMNLHYQSHGRKTSPMHRAVLYQSPTVVEAMLKLGATVNLQDVDKKTPMESLCSMEDVWKSERGKGLSKERLAVFRILLKHGSFTQSCRDSIDKWKNKDLQAALVKELPWRNPVEMATAAASWTLYTAIPVTAKTVAIAGVVVVGLAQGSKGVKR